jgi:hypothetical protein
MEDTTIYNEETQTNKTNETSFFRKVAFLLLDKENKENIAQEINNNENFGKIYRVQLILSVIISTLGLLINSVPVIIGAMLISPILLPIKKLAFSLATGHISTYKK